MSGMGFSFHAHSSKKEGALLTFRRAFDKKMVKAG
jgi:hypothetical protein